MSEPRDLPCSMLWSASSSAWKRTPPMEDDSRLIFSTLSDDDDRSKEGPEGDRLARAIGARSPRFLWTSQSRRAKASGNQGASLTRGLARSRRPWAADSGERHFLPVATTLLPDTPPASTTCVFLSSFPQRMLSILPAGPGGRDEDPHATSIFSLGGTSFFFAHHDDNWWYLDKRLAVSLRPCHSG